MDALFSPQHLGIQFISDEAVRLSSKGPEADLFYLKRSRTWEQREMISLMLSPLWTGSLMTGVFKIVLQMIPKGMASEQPQSAARSRQVLRTTQSSFSLLSQSAALSECYLPNKIYLCLYLKSIPVTRWWFQLWTYPLIHGAFPLWYF